MTTVFKEDYWEDADKHIGWVPVPDFERLAAGRQYGRCVRAEGQCADIALVRAVTDDACPWRGRLLILQVESAIPHRVVGEQAHSLENKYL